MKQPPGTVPSPNIWHHTATYELENRAADPDGRLWAAMQARADWGGPVEDILTAAPAHQLVDALFGTGLTRGLEAGLAKRLCDLTEAAGHSYAIDLPSGISTDNGALLSAVPHFDICIALGQWKRAHMLRPAISCWDRMVCCDIGIEAPEAKIRRIAKPEISAPDRKSTRLNSSHTDISRMPSSA